MPLSTPSDPSTPRTPDPEKPLRIPPWLRMKLPQGGALKATRELLADLHVHTVCQGAKCPNIWECFSGHTAAFLVLGPQCTRNCAFCNITPGRPGAPDPDEPRRVAEAARRLKLGHVVVTSVTRDDLPDGGAAHFAAVTAALRRVLPGSTVELLIPDFQGDDAALRTVLDAGPDVLNHNLETVRSLYRAVRPQADYDRSLRLLARARELGARRVKSGLMVGLGETFSEIQEAIRDLARAGCHTVTVGQYMQPSAAHPRVKNYLTPQEFFELDACGRHHGIPQMFCAPRVRSSYHAKEVLRENPA
ncbi:MAG: lipoyl synthase [Desulfovibrionaceae bacterium]